MKHQKDFRENDLDIHLIKKNCDYKNVLRRGGGLGSEARACECLLTLTTITTIKISTTVIPPISNNVF
jgi:hypothetical protein